MEQCAPRQTRLLPMRPPRICLLGLDNLSVLAPEASGQPPGGEPVQQTLLARALVRRGFEVSTIVADDRYPDGATREGITTYRAYRPSAGLPVLRFFHPRWSGVMSALRRAAADVYYTSCASITVAQLSQVAAERGARSVFRIASDSDCDPRRLLIRLWRDRKIYEHGLRRVDAILAQSQHQARLLRTNYGRESSVAGMFVAPPVSIPEFDARGTPALWVSNIRHVKRPDVLLQLATAAPQVGFTMVGGPVSGAEAEFVAARQAASGLPNVRFAGPIPFAEVARSFADARVFVNTSDVEGFPNSYLQAWIHGVPVVAFFDPDGLIAREGLGVAVSSVDEMKEAVIRLSSDERAWQDASVRCMQFMAREFSEERVLEPYLRAFGLLDARPEARP